MKNPRAYYVGGFSVGCGVPRVEILHKFPADSGPEKYQVRTVSRKCYAFPKGEVFTALAVNLFDTMRIISGPRCTYAGKTWKDSI